MSQSFDIAVIGGGVVGLSTALAMNLRGYTVALIDAGSLSVDSSEPDARVYAINQASEELFMQLGVWQHLQTSRLSPYQQMLVWDAANGAHIEFDARMVAASHLGTMIEESVLKEALLHALSLQKTRLTLFPHTLVNHVKPCTESISIFGTNFSAQAQLLMIADGGNSPCRELLKVPMTSWSYHQEAIVARVHTEKPHLQTAYQVFNGDGPLAFLPMAEEKSSSIVWSTTPSRAKALMALSDEAFNQELCTAFAAKLGQTSVQGRRFQFPLTMRHAQQYTGHRWVLLGDAAHTIHPLAGLGLNVGLADLSTWLNGLNGTKPFTSKRVQGAYQRQRKFALWQIIATMEGLKTLFINPLPPVVALRDLGLRFCNGFQPIKRLFIEQAMGKTLEKFF